MTYKLISPQQAQLMRQAIPAGARARDIHNKARLRKLSHRGFVHCVYLATGSIEFVCTESGREALAHHESA